MERTMIVVAGGSGTRMGAGIPKQFILLDGRPVLMRTLEMLHGLDSNMPLILVLPEAQLERWDQLVQQYAFTIPHRTVGGGATRFLSVSNGLELVDSELVGIHDGVRPFLDGSVLNACFDAAAYTGAAVPVVPIVQSLRMLDADGNSHAVDRNLFRAVQTPQCFRTEMLKQAFSATERTDFSDDASVAESFGTRIELVNGDPYNIKITTPFDMELAHLIIRGLNHSD